MRVAGIVLAAVMAAGAAPAPQKPAVMKLRPDAPENVKAFWEKSQKTTVDAIAEATQSVEMLQARVKKSEKAGSRNPSTAGRQSPEDRAVKMRVSLAEQQDRLRDLKSGKLVEYADLSLSVGSIGVVGRDYTTGTHERITTVGFKVEQVIDKGAAIVKPVIRGHASDNSVWLEGVDTSKMTDDTSIKAASELYEVTGTKQYSTAIGGTRTVLVMRPFDLSPYLQISGSQTRRASPVPSK